jgi:membrane glycosyltransferase
VALRAAHESFLAETPRRRRGDVDVAIAVAAKLNDGQTLEDARAWLNSRERLAVLNDRALIAMLARLPNAAAQVNAA